MIADTLGQDDPPREVGNGSVASCGNRLTEDVIGKQTESQRDCRPPSQEDRNLTCHPS